MFMTYKGFCESGNRNGENQDAIGMFAAGDTGLFLVADGMGGHSDGSRASRLIRAECETWWKNYIKNNKQNGFLQNVKDLKAFVAAVNKKIWDQTDRNEICGSTIVLLFIYQDHYAVLWAGDSRCYLTENKRLMTRTKQLTIDDVWEQQPEIKKGFSKEFIKSHSNQGKLVRAVGAKPQLSCSVLTAKLTGDSLFMLCSDGIFKYIDRNILDRHMKAAVRTAKLHDSLLAVKYEIYNNHAPDNLSCIMIHIQAGHSYD